MAGNTLLRISTYPVAPYVTKCFLEKQKNDSCQRFGLDAEIFMLLMSALNYSYHLLPTNETTYGVVGPDGMWDGLIGEIIAGKIDTAPNLFTLNKDRFQSLKMTRPVVFGKRAFLIKRPKLKELEFVFAIPFSRMVWMGCSACFLAVLFASCLNGWFGVENGNDRRKNATRKVWLLIPPLFRQSVPFTTTQSDSMRILFTFWHGFLLVMTPLYTGKLVSVFAQRGANLPFADSYEFGNAIFRGEYRMVTHTTSNSVFMEIEKSNSVGYQLIREGIKQHGILMQPNMESVVRLIANSSELLATLNSKFFLNWASKDYPNLAIIEDTLGSEMWGAFGFGKNFSDFTHFDEALELLREIGGIQKVEKPYQHQEQKLKRSNQLHRLPMGAMKETFIILPSGFIIALAFLIAEHLWKQFHEKLQHNPEIPGPTVLSSLPFIRNY